MSTFKPASKASARLRMTLIGPPGAGKTFSALSIARGIGPGKRIAVIDTEHGSASKYAGTGKDQFTFDVLELTNFDPRNYIAAIQAAEAEGFDVLIIDSLSHAWSGTGGALEMVNKEAARSRSNNTYFAWRDVTPLHNALIDAIIASRCHVITTMRTKYETVLETDDRGKITPRIIGLDAVQRNGMEYEFDVVGDLDLKHDYRITKTRYSAIDGEVVNRPGVAFGQRLLHWLTDGVDGGLPATQSIPDEMVARIKANVRRLEMTNEQLLGALARRGGVSDITRLSPSNAEEFLRALDGRVYQMNLKKEQEEMEKIREEGEAEVDPDYPGISPVASASAAPSADRPATNMVEQAWNEFQVEHARGQAEQGIATEKAITANAASIGQQVASDPSADDFVITDADRREGKESAEKKGKSKAKARAAQEAGEPVVNVNQ